MEWHGWRDATADARKTDDVEGHTIAHTVDSKFELLDTSAWWAHEGKEQVQESWTRQYGTAHV